MSGNAFRNATISVAIFFTLIFVLATIHNYNTTLKAPAQANQNDGALRKSSGQNFSSYSFKLKDVSTATKFDHQNVTDAELSSNFWTFVHLASAFSPLQPTEEDQAKVKFFLKALAEFYPNKKWGQRLLKLFIENPIKAETKYELMLYLCEIHNILNKENGKPEFDCETVDDYWGGDCGCKKKDGN